MDFKERLRILRLIRGFETSAALARAMGEDASHLAKLESGIIGEPKDALKRKLAKALGVSVAVIMGDEPIPGLGDREATVADLRLLAAELRHKNPVRGLMLETLARRLEKYEDDYFEYLGTRWEYAESQAAETAKDEQCENDEGREEPLGPPATHKPIPD